MQKELTLEITNRCQLECSFCSTNASIDDVYQMDKEEIKAYLTGFGDLDATIRFSGGEPTLHPDILELLKYTTSLGYRNTRLFTNGLYLANENYSVDFDPGLFVYETVVHICSELSIKAVVDAMKRPGGCVRRVSLHVVNVLGNEEMISNAIALSRKYRLPLRILKLQKQGRGTSSQDSNIYLHLIQNSDGLISFTGCEGCHKELKTTVRFDGYVTSCTAFKLKSSCDLYGIEEN